MSVCRFCSNEMVDGMIHDCPPREFCQKHHEHRCYDCLQAEHAKEIEKLMGERDAALASLSQVDEVLVVNWVGPRVDGDYTKALADLVTSSIQIHDDPAVSEVAAKRLEEITRLKEHRTRLRKAVSGVLGGLGPTSAVWGNSPYDRALCNGVTAALTAFDDECKRIDAEPPAKPIAGEPGT